MARIGVSPFTARRKSLVKSAAPLRPSPSFGVSGSASLLSDLYPPVLYPSVSVSNLSSISLLSIHYSLFTSTNYSYLYIPGRRTTAKSVALPPLFAVRRRTAKPQFAK